MLLVKRFALSFGFADRFYVIIDKIQADAHQISSVGF